MGVPNSWLKGLLGKQKLKLLPLCTLMSPIRPIRRLPPETRAVSKPRRQHQARRGRKECKPDYHWMLHPAALAILLTSSLVRGHGRLIPEGTDVAVQNH